MSEIYEMSTPIQVTVQATQGTAYVSSFGGMIVVFFDTHAAGICAMVAVLSYITSTGLNWYYKHRASK